MVGIQFARPVGPFADTKELEYISALHQTGEPLRQNGTIQARDIMYFLSSRHGIRVEEDVVMSSIVLEMGGSLPIAPPSETPTVTEGTEDVEQAPKSTSSNPLSKLFAKKRLSKESFEDEGGDPSDSEEEDEEDLQPVLDVCQLLALLMIPFLRQGNQADKNLVMSRGKSMLGSFRAKAMEEQNEREEHARELVGHVLELALRNLIGEFQLEEGEDSVDAENNGILLTPKILRRILETFGEFDVPHELIQEMIRAAKVDAMGGSNTGKGPDEVFLNKAAFLHALTADTQLWDPSRIDTSENTHFKDAMRAHLYREEVLYGKSKMLDRRRRPSKPAPMIPQHHQGNNDDMDDSNAVVSNIHAVPYKKIYMAASIDNNADNYRNGPWFALVWVEAVLIYFAYLAGTGLKFTTEQFPNCTSELGCKIGVSLLSWIVVFAELSIMGLTWVVLASLGNTNQPTKTVLEKVFTVVRLVVSMTVVVIVTIVTFAVETKNEIFDTVKIESKQPAYWTAFLGGIVILFLQLTRLVSVFFPVGRLESGGMGKKEKTIKSAAASKIQTIVEHAMFLHELPPKFKSMRLSSVTETVRSVASVLHRSSSSEGRKSRKNAKGSTMSKALLNFHRMNDTVEVQGGVFWTARGLWNGTLLQREGIFLHGRLLAVNFVQFFIIFLMVSTYVTVMRFLNQNVTTKDDGCLYTVGEGLNPDVYDPNWNRTTNGFFNLYNINATHFGIAEWGLVYEGQMPKFNGSTFQLPNGLTSPSICYEEWMINASGTFYNEQASSNQLIEMLDLSPWQFRLGLSIGLFGALLGVSAIACVYVPSFVSSVLKLRSGFNPSLKGDYEGFLMFRKSPDATSILFGCNLWGCFYTALIAFAIFGIVAFVTIWPMTRSYVFTFIAGYFGLAITIGLKVIVMKFLRSALYSGYYRKRPAAANFTNVILECWSLGLSAGTVTSRFIKLIVVTGFYVGRIDTPVFAPGVGYVGNSPLDPAPHAFYKDLLLHEAHRHPFIERLGLLYLLKLNNGKQFCTRAGAHWRILFVLALLPWMRNYRVRDGHEQLMDDDDDEDLSPAEQLQKEFNRGGAKAGAMGDMRDEMDLLGMQIELDVTRRAYEKLARKNRDLKAALKATKEKARESRRENKSLRHSLADSNRGFLQETMHELGAEIHTPR
ncbi:expressed unknown protein [Seminavis robusta]|uniref:Uncharacterized protein n=1 Tax=Seminavis robusta TaxID=568900 RepID=A0A9N8E6X5_9STRA|nr:expressed unknown protein [Seminavis robusta]|eukprot:Sro614_g175750.1 n/a (1163) ;mRNA; r:31269-35927